MHNSVSISDVNTSVASFSGKLRCRLGDCERVIKGIRSGELTVHPDGRVTLLSHEKAQVEIAKYQEILKERPDCSAAGNWKEGLSAAAEDFGLTEKVIDAGVKALESVYGKAGRVLGYLVSVNVESGSKSTERIAKDTFEDLAPEDAVRLMKRGNLLVTAYDIGHATFKAQEAMQDHERRCAYYSAIEGSITQLEEASTVPIAWVIPNQKGEESSTNGSESEKPQPETTERKDLLPNGVPEIVPREPENEKPALEKRHEQPPRTYSVLNINTAKIQKSAVTLNHRISDDMSGSLSLSPGNLKKSALGLSYKNIGYSRSLDGRHSQISLSGKVKGVDGSIGFDPKRPLKGNVHMECGCDKGRIAADINMHKPLKSRLQGEAIVPVSGVPLKIGGKIKLSKPQDAQVKVSLPTGVFDKALPKCMKIGDVQLFSSNGKKIRNGLKKITGIGRNKKRKALKRVRKQVAAINEEQKRIRHMREQWFRELTDWVIEKVDEAYAPILAKEIGDLNRDLEQFIEDVFEFPMLDLPEIERQSLSLNPDRLIWDETKWEEFFTNAAGALFEMREENKALSRLVSQLEELSNSLLLCKEKMDRISEQYQEVQTTFDETVKLMQILANSEQISARLRDNVSPEVLIKATELLNKDK